MLTALCGKTMRILFIIASIFLSINSYSVEYSCEVERKLNKSFEYSDSQLIAGKYSLKIEELGDKAFISRCSFSSSENAVICDRYEIDKVVSDSFIKAKKYYMFSSQFDVQIFKNMSFIENNGRNGISYGKCKISSP